MWNLQDGMAARDAPFLSARRRYENVLMKGGEPISRNFSETYHNNNIFLRADRITMEKTRMYTQHFFIFYHQKYINITINKNKK